MLLSAQLNDIEIRVLSYKLWQIHIHLLNCGIISRKEQVLSPRVTILWKSEVIGLLDHVCGACLLSCSYLWFHVDACLLVHICGFILMPACLYLGFHFDACLSQVKAVKYRL